MGIISSKLLKNDSKPTKVTTAMQTETPRETTQIPDVRSPTANIERTPIIVEKLKSELDTPVEYRSLPLRNRLLKNLKQNPRSPTLETYRTLVLVENTPPSKTSPNNTDSPVSIYSSNFNDSHMDGIMTPIEPSVNVSGFEIPKEVFCGEHDVTLGEMEVTETEENKSCLTVSEKPNTYEAKKLLEEIISDEENFLKKVKMPMRKPKKPSFKNTGKNTNEIKGKLRPPLSNITSSANSPISVNTGIKGYSRNKVVSDFGLENSVSPNVKHMAQWDQNNTVVI